MIPEEDDLDPTDRSSTSMLPRGWRSVFGQARPEEIEPVNEILTEEFGHVDPDDWH